MKRQDLKQKFKKSIASVLVTIMMISLLQGIPNTVFAAIVDTLVNPQFVYNNVYILNDPNLNVVNKSERWGAIDNSCNVVIPFIYVEMGDFSNGLARVRRDYKYGFINNKGEEIIPCIYEDASSFSENLVAVKKSGKWGFVNTSGMEIVPFIYDECQGFSEGRAVVKKNGKYGVINNIGAEITEFKYECIYSFWEGIAQVFDEVSTGFIDASGNEIVPCGTSIYDVNYYSEGAIEIKKDGKWGYINSLGKEIVPFIYDETQPFNEGLAMVKKNGNWGFVNKSGEVVIPCIYEDASFCFGGIISVKMSSKWGCINSVGVEILPCIYDDVFNYGEGYISLLSNGKQGCANSLGAVIIPCTYDYIGYFSEGLVNVGMGGKYGFVNESNELITSMIYDYRYSYYENGFAKVSKNGKVGCVNTFGEEVIPCNYNDIIISNNLVFGKINYRWGIIAKLKLTDIGNVIWAQEAITDLAKKSIVNGYDDGTFRPNNNITRAEFIKMLTVAFGIYNPNATSTFTDLEANGWYVPYIGSAEAEGIANGKGAGMFCPNDTITREEMFTLCARAIEKYKSVKMIENTDLIQEQLNMFVDAQDVSSWATQCIATNIKVGLIAGAPVDGGGKSINPKKAMTRAEVAVTLFRAMKL